MKALCDIGLIGLAVMGENLVRNMAGKGIQVAVYNRTARKPRPLWGAWRATSAGMCCCIGGGIGGHVGRQMSMVGAGRSVDDMIAQLLPHLEACWRAT